MQYPRRYDKHPADSTETRESIEKDISTSTAFRFGIILVVITIIGIVYIAKYWQ